MEQEPPDKQQLILLIFSLLLVFVCYGIQYYYKPFMEPIGAITFSAETSLINENSYLNRNIPNIPYVYVNGTLIDCLIFYESSGRVDAIGDNGKSKGILQFQVPTYKHFCIDKYGLPDDMMNPENQKRCSDYMISDGLSFHWSTLKLCQ